MSRSFDGSNDQLRIDSAVVDATAVDTTPVSFACWIKRSRSSHSEEEALMTAGVQSGTNHYLRLLVGTDNTVTARTRTSTNGNAVSSATITDTNWHLIVAVYAGIASRTIYVDGNAGVSNTDSRDPTTATNCFAIGADTAVGGTKTNEFAGLIAYPTVWGGVALSSGDVAALWNGGAGVDPLTVQNANIVAHWDLTGNESPEIDDVGAFDLTVVGTTFSADDPFAVGGVTGTGAVTLGAITVAGTAERTVTGSGAVTLGAITVAGAGAVSGEVSGTGAITLGPIAVAGTAEREVTDVGGAIALTLPAITVSGTGTVTIDTIELVVADALHAHTVDNVALTQAHVLAVADALHDHTTDNVVLGVGISLAVADTLHAHAADAVTLTQAGALIVDDALHAHSVDSLALIQANVLAVADALHAHSVDNVETSNTLNLAVDDALHSHLADSLALIQAHVLAVADALHAHGVDSVELTQASTLIVDDSLHAHLSDLVSLRLPAESLDQDVLFYVSADQRLFIVSREGTVH